MRTWTYPKPRQNPESKPQVLYSLFKRENGAWIRCRTTAYPERFAFKVFRDEVISNPYNFQIRPVRIEKPRAGHFTGVTYKELRDSPLNEKNCK